MNPENINEQLDYLVRKYTYLALIGSIGSCTCLTKSPEINSHAGNCIYKQIRIIAQEGIDMCEEIRKSIK